MNYYVDIKDDISYFPRIDTDFLYDGLMGLLLYYDDRYIVELDTLTLGQLDNMIE